MMSDTQKRPIRSFVRREGRMTPAQQYALDNFWSIYGVEVSQGSIDCDVLEIGFGNGESLLAMAKAHPEQIFLGIEVHRPGVGALLAALQKEGVHNVKVICHDAIEVLKQNIKDKSLSKIQIYFPDPWPKKRHHKRRLIQPEFIKLVTRKLKKGGQLHLATDWEDYALQMMEVLSEVSELENVTGVGQFIPNDQLRPETKFERRGKKLGHDVWDLLFVRL